MSPIYLIALFDLSYLQTDNGAAVDIPGTRNDLNCIGKVVDSQENEKRAFGWGHEEKREAERGRDRKDRKSAMFKAACQIVKTLLSFFLSFFFLSFFTSKFSWFGFGWTPIHMYHLPLLWGSIRDGTNINGYEGEKISGGTTTAKANRKESGLIHIHVYIEYEHRAFTICIKISSFTSIYIYI